MANSNQLGQLNVKIDQIFELTNAVIDVCTVDLFQPGWTKFFYAETRHCRTNDDRALHVLERDVAAFGQITDESARERIAGTGRIVDFFER